MYGLAKNIDLNFFLEKELIQLCLGKFVFNLNFNENISISVEAGGFTLNNKRYKDQEESHKGYLLHILLGQKITAATHGEGAGDLQLDFEGGHRLILHDDFKQFQSYNFTSPKGLVVV